MGGLLGGLVEGFVRATGAPETGNLLAQQRNQRQKLSDEELQSNLDLYNQALDKLTTSIGQIPPDQRNPQNAQWASLNDALHKTISARTALFHPQYGPSAMSRLAEMLKLKKRVPANAGEAKADMAGVLAQSAPTSTEYQPTREEAAKGWRISHGLEAREAPTKTRFVREDGKDAAGNPMTIYRDYADPSHAVNTAGQDIPAEALAGFKANPKTAVGGFEPDIKNGMFFGVTGPNKEKYSVADLKAGKAPQEALDLYSEYLTGEKEKISREDKKFNERLSAMTTAFQLALQRNDYVLAGKEVTKAKSDYEASIDRMNTMDANLKDIQTSYKSGTINQQAMLSMVANHIGMTLGAQKGARITRAVWDEATASAPWLAKLGARWSPDGYLTGVTITGDQAQQMVDLAHEKVDILKEHVGRIEEDYKDALGVKKPPKNAGEAKKLIKGSTMTDDEFLKKF